ncbi:MAG TPA: hypothetical protein DC017_06865 [Candidatus Wallbacteria bacterium]|nr:hypothetical protein [Candidatus Wallbacteria bacterium]
MKVMSMNYPASRLRFSVRSALLLVLSVLACITVIGGVSYADEVSNVLDSLNKGRITSGVEGTVNVSEDSYLNVRTGPGTNYQIIGKLHRGDNAKILEENLGWYKINYNGSTAWINGYYVSGVQLNNMMPDNIYGTVSLPDAESVSLRVGAGINNPAVDTLSNGARFRVLDKQDGWYKIEVAGHSNPLWINGSFVKLIDTIEDPPSADNVPAYVDVDSSLNLRSGPSTSNPIMQELADRTQLTIIGVEGDWYKVKLSNGTIGYCHSSYIKKGAPPAADTTTTTGPGVSDASSGGKNVLESIQLPSDPGGVTPEVASQILAGLGYGRFNGFGESLKKFQSATFGSWSAGKTYTKGSLDEATKKKLLEHGKMLQAALAKYPAGTVSKTSPEFAKWVSNSAATMKNMPSGLVDNSGNSISKEALVHGILTQESGKYHWRDRKMIISSCGAMGFMQIMPFHTDSAGNIYDPEVNLAFGVKYIDTQLGRSDWKTSGDDASSMLAKALAAYNGGPGRAALKNMSWEQIVNSNSIPRESIHYAISIRKRLNVRISAAEEAWLNSH